MKYCRNCLAKVELDKVYCANCARKVRMLRARRTLLALVTIALVFYMRANPHHMRKAKRLAGAVRDMTVATGRAIAGLARDVRIGRDYRPLLKK